MFYIVKPLLNTDKAAKVAKASIFCFFKLKKFICTLGAYLILLKLKNLQLYHYSNFMSSEPIIIEEPSTKATNKPNNNLQEQTFFKVMDEIEEYDNLLTSARYKYQEAMLSLASIKFQNPYALNVNAHRCTPAFLKISQNQVLQYGYSQFTNPVSEDQVYPDEYEQQAQIQKQCLQKQETLTRMDSKAERQGFCQKQLLYRFNVLNSPEKVIATASKFKETLQLLLKQAGVRRKFEEKLKSE